MNLYSVPTEPSIGLMASIAMRFNHSFGMPKHETFSGSGYYQGFNKEDRIALLARLRRIYDIVVKQSLETQDMTARIPKTISKALMVEIHKVDEKILKEDVVRMIEEITGNGFYQEAKEDYYKDIVSSEDELCFSNLPRK